MDARRIREVIQLATRRGWLEADALWKLAEVVSTGRVEEARAELAQCLGNDRLWELLSEGSPSAAAAPSLTLPEAEPLTPPPAPTPIPRTQTGYVQTLLGPLTGGATEAAPGARPPTESRYRIDKELGRGGMGTVFSAEDTQLGRMEALKVLNEHAASFPDVVRRFLTEARITAQLEHPGIVPVYNLGLLPSGEPFYTMRAVESHSMADVLRKPEVHQKFPLVRLLAVFSQVCCAMSYAHSRGVIHRDLKPENILIGNYGEVYVTDWGIAKVLGNEVGAPTAPASETQHGSFLGSPGYMPPEQIVDASSVDARSDIFSLGVILYEILTARLPFSRPTPIEIVSATLREEVRPPRAINAQAPLLLEELCLHCLAKEPARRPTDLGEVVHELEQYLEGSKERERKREQAARLVEEARDVKITCDALFEEIARLRVESQLSLLAVLPSDPVELKQPSWQLEDLAAQAEREHAEAFGEATVLLGQALGHEPDNAAARQMLAELYWMRLVQAERERNRGGRGYFERLMRQYDDGTFSQRLRERARVSLSSTPPGAGVVAHRYVTGERVYRVGERRMLGATPLEVELPAGSWLLELSAPGFQPARVHLDLQRGERLETRVRLLAEGEVPTGFVYVPAGPTTVGGDDDAQDAVTERRVHVGAFLIGRLPVTFREYRRFLEQTGHGDVQLPPVTRAGGDDGELIDFAVGGVDWFDAAAYCRWRSERECREVRLPTELEWEKAMRGADRRYFPWGDHFDATYCKMRDSRPGVAEPEAPGTFRLDISPYGVCDAAGGMREWTADIEGESDARATLAAAEAAPRGLLGPRHVLRGGSWMASAPECRLAARFRAPAALRRAEFGFRVVIPL